MCIISLGCAGTVGGNSWEVSLVPVLLLTACQSASLAVLLQQYPLWPVAGQGMSQRPCPTTFLGLVRLSQGLMAAKLFGAVIVFGADVVIGAALCWGLLMLAIAPHGSVPSPGLAPVPNPNEDVKGRAGLKGSAPHLKAYS